MALATWWRSDPLPSIPVLPDLHVAIAEEDTVLAELNRIPIDEVRARRSHGHRPYVAHLRGAPVAYGWVAARIVSIGELNLTLALPPTDRYLWDFATLAAWQGRGLYPRLLQVILQQEASTAERFWIIYAPENLPSAAGMWKAGFTPAAELSFDADRNVRLAPTGPIERAQVAAKLLGVPLVDDPLAPCWCCQSSQEATCWPAQVSAAQVCTCAIERRPASVPAPLGA
jgi:GNAT superfamily N-acetyltransferase